MNMNMMVLVGNDGEQITQTINLKPYNAKEIAHGLERMEMDGETKNATVIFGQGVVWQFGFPMSESYRAHKANKLFRSFSD